MSDHVTTYRIETTDPLEHEQHLRGLDALLALWALRDRIHRILRGKETGDLETVQAYLIELLDERGLDLERLVP